MGFSFHFESLERTLELKQLLSFLNSQDLGYPKYHDWVEKSEHELDKGYKSAVLGLSDGKIVADLIYQPHKSVPLLTEIKNVRVDNRFSTRYFASFMLRQVEFESRKEGNLGLICDSRLDRTDLIGFMLSRNYRQLTILPLYESEKADVVLVKVFNTNSENILTNLKNNIRPVRAG